MNESMNYEAVCRTAPATPGLLINIGSQNMQFFTLIVLVKPVLLTKSKHSEKEKYEKYKVQGGLYPLAGWLYLLVVWLYLPAVWLNPHAGKASPPTDYTATTYVSFRKTLVS